MNHAPDVMQRRQLRLGRFIGIVFIAAGVVCAVRGVGVMFLGG